MRDAEKQRSSFQPQKLHLTSTVRLASAKLESENLKKLTEIKKPDI